MTEHVQRNYNSGDGIDLKMEFLEHLGYTFVDV